MQVARKVGSAIFGLLFLLGVVVQYNDPDPVPWMLVYAGAFIACLLSVIGKPQHKLAGLVGAVALVWAVILVPRVLGQLDFGSMFNEVGMATLEIEEGREALGLGMIAGWMGVLFFSGRRGTGKTNGRNGEQQERRTIRRANNKKGEQQERRTIRTANNKNGEQ